MKDVKINVSAKQKKNLWTAERGETTGAASKFRNRSEAVGRLSSRRHSLFIILVVFVLLCVLVFKIK